jgi:hypothetical protein
MENKTTHEMFGTERGVKLLKYDNYQFLCYYERTTYFYTAVGIVRVVQAKKTQNKAFELINIHICSTLTVYGINLIKLNMAIKKTETYTLYTTK